MEPAYGDEATVIQLWRMIGEELVFNTDTQKAVIALADGTCLWGRSYGYPAMAKGELVFNTAMTGYQEILTDPSYAGQIIMFTYPHLGNTGINTEDKESDQIHAAAMVLREPSLVVSNQRAKDSLDSYLKKQRCPAIADIDTRRLTRLLRDKGCQNACIMTYTDQDKPQDIADQAVQQARAMPPIHHRDWAQEVSSSKTKQWHDKVWQQPDGPQGSIKPEPDPEPELKPEQPDPKPELKSEPKPKPKAKPEPKTDKAEPHIIVYDCGVKHNILRLLKEQHCRVTYVPLNSDPEQIVKQHQPDGVLISNGPGDPVVCRQMIETIRYFLKHRIPLFGICLGHQLLGLACQAKVFKMKHGHHGANHPVKDITNGKVLITSQNHNFALKEDSLPDNIRITHRSLFDDTIQGIQLLDRPAFSFQGHPEASPGPHDLNYLFARFVSLITDHH